jgi:hypothetical protein
MNSRHKVIFPAMIGLQHAVDHGKSARYDCQKYYSITKLTLNDFKPSLQLETNLFIFRES